MKFLLRPLALMLCTLAASPLSASVIFNDEFITGAGGYTADANLIGQNPATTGFTNAWVNSTTSVNTSVATNLAMNGVTNTGGSLLVNYASFNQTRNNTRAFSNTSSSNVLWISSLASFSSAALSNTGSSGGSFYTGILSGNLSTYSASGTTAALWSTDNGGSLSGVGFGMRNGALRLNYQTGSSTVASVAINPAFSLVADTAYLFVIKLEINPTGNDVLNVWFLNSAVANEASLGTPTLSITNANILSSSSELTRLAYYSAAPYSNTNGSVPASTTWDAVRMGTSFSDLSIIPEPSAFVMATLGSIVFLCLRRRSRRD